MALFHDSAIAGASGQAVGDAYKIERSLRFNGSADSAYLSRTPASAGNRKTWTWSGWVKRGLLSSDRRFFEAGTSSTNVVWFGFSGNGSFAFEEYLISSYRIQLYSNSLYRDTSAWYHFVVAVDTTQSTSSDRVKVYVNGIQITSFSPALYPDQNIDTRANNTVLHTTGGSAVIGGTAYLDGYLADIHFIDGQALTPSSFAETNITTGQWVPKAYTGTYGTNGFRLAFADNSNNTATTLGKDSSPNGNNWTPNNLSVTAGAGNDSLVDTPTSYGTDTGAGGEVRGNYPTLNPLSKGSQITLSNGNLDYSHNGLTVSCQARSTIAITSGKWYCEHTTNSGGTFALVGIVSAAEAPDSGYVGQSSTSYGYYASNGGKYNNSVSTTYGATYTNGDVVGIAFDADNGTLTFYKNGISQGTAFSSIPTGTYLFAQGNYPEVTYAGSFNFGQRPFAYTAPSGFKALCDTNLPAPVVAKPNSVFDVLLYTGNGSSSRAITGLQFSPDFIWGKERNSTNWHNLVDIVRGASKRLYSNSTIAEEDVPTSFISFDSGGFTIGNDNATNENSAPYVAWCWDAGSSTTTNTQGSITSQVRANASAGFSIVAYTGNGISGANVGHGLGIAPSMIIQKERSQGTGGWSVYHVSIGPGAYLGLNSTSGVVTSNNQWGGVSPTSNVFTLGGSGEINDNGQTNIAYCFAQVAGYSSFGSYTGNGSADGPFIYTGFRSRWVLIKKSSSTSSWYILDTARDLYNQSGLYLYPDLSNAEDDQRSVYPWDILSNGFKPRAASGSVINDNGATYIYAAFAENPFQFARAR